MIAEIAPATHGDWLNNLQFFLLLVIAIGQVRMIFVKEPQKTEISFADQFARKEDLKNLQHQFSRLEQHMDTLCTEWRQDKDQIIAAGERRAVAIHERINTLSVDLTSAVGELRGQLRGHSNDS